MHRLHPLLCVLLLTLVSPALAGPAAGPATLTKGEKVALAVLAQMTSPSKSRAAKASRLFARLPDADKPAALRTALTVQPARLRILAAGELARLGDARAAAPLLAQVLRECSPKARRALAEAAGRLRAPRSVPALASALHARDEVVRRRAAEALGYLGDAAAMPYLVATWEARSGEFPRSHFAQTTQVAHIQDFDVEVA